MDGYYDANWAVNTKDMKRTPRGYLFLGNDMTLCFSKKHICVSTSIAEEEHIDAGSSWT